MAVTNPNEVITKQDLKDFYDEILPYLGGNLPVLGTIDRSMIFDTTEKVVGKFTDGKPIYQKSFTDTLPNCTTTGTEVSKNISIGASIDKIIGYDGFAISSSNSIIPLVTYTYSDSANKFVRIQFFNNSASSNANCISLRNAWNSYNGATVIITIRYTKTTDAANSYNYSSENDYSTSEKVIGTWIDGGTLYQKTVNLGTLPNTTLKSVAHGISSLGTVVNVIGTAKNTSGTTILLNHCDGLNNAKSVWVTVDATYINVQTAADRTTFTGYVTIQYTKTS